MDWKRIGLHVLSGLLGLMFVMAGFGKLSGAEMNVTNFTNWGYPLWFMTVTGLIEVVSAVAIVVPKTRFYGASVLVAVMFGATATHFVNTEWVAVPITVVLGGLAFLLAYTHRPELLMDPGASRTAPGSR